MDRCGVWIGNCLRDYPGEDGRWWLWCKRSGWVFVIPRGSKSKQQRLLRDYPGSVMRE